MEPQAEVLGKVSQLSLLNAELLKEIGVLEEGRDSLDRHFESNLSSLNQTVSNAQTQTQTSLDTTSKRIACAQQEIKENEQLSAEMSAKARDHDERAEGNNVVCAVAG
jgi:hypothetical protein